MQTISGLIPVLPAVGLPPTAVEAASTLGKRFARLRESWAETGGSTVGRVRELGDERTALLSVIDPEDLRQTLKEFFDEAAFLSPHGLRAVSKRYENNPYTLEGVAGRVDRLRAGRVDDDDVRRQLELARPDLDARSTTSRSASSSSTSASSATTSSSSTRPARARSTRSARSRRTSPTGSSRSGCPAPTAAARSTAAPSGCRATRPGRTTSSSTSTSTATTAPASARRTRPAGRRSSPT